VNRVLLAVAAGCSSPSPITSCESDLTGIYDADGKRWMLAESRGALEAYPIHDDSGSGDVAPRWLELARTPSGITGLVRRRFSLCDSEAPVRLTTCTDDTLELVLADPPPPLGKDPCRFGRPDSSRRERWTRVR
jgi:hypothetical protein